MLSPLKLVTWGLITSKSQRQYISSHRNTLLEMTAYVTPIKEFAGQTRISLELKRERNGMRVYLSLTNTLEPGDEIMRHRDQLTLRAAPHNFSIRWVSM